MSEVTGNGTGARAAPGRSPPRPTDSPLADAAGLGLSVLAEVLVRTEDGIVVLGADRRYVYVNPAACEMLGRPIGQLRGRDFLDSFEAREQTRVLSHLPQRLGDRGPPVTCALSGSEREIAYATFAIDVSGSLHHIVVLRDFTGTRAAARSASALAQMAAQLARTGTTINDVLVQIARHAVEGTRALSAGIIVMGDDHKLGAGGGYSPVGPNSADASPTWEAQKGIPGEEVIAAMTDGAVRVGDVPGEPVVFADGRSAWEANPISRVNADRLANLDWRAACVCPISWENRVFGYLRTNFPSRVTRPSESELAFYVALADQAALAVMNDRFATQAGQAAALVERARLARELHDSVSQALFSMTMHARAAQLSMTKVGADDSGPLGRSLSQLAELAGGALAEMRALIFELRPGALAEEGLVGALRKRAASVTAREDVAVTVVGPEERLHLEPGVEEHLYRVASEALHNVVKHAQARTATVEVIAGAGGLQMTVRDDGCGFDPSSQRAGHLGMATMAQRTDAIGADLAVTASPGAGTTVSVSLAGDPKDRAQADGADDRAEAHHVATPDRSAEGTGGRGLTARSKTVSAGREGPSGSGRDGGPKGTDVGGTRRAGPLLVDDSALADAAGLGLSILAAVVAGRQDGIAIVDGDQRYVYANPAACRMLGHPLDRLRGRDFLGSFPTREHPSTADRLPGRLDDQAAPFTCTILGPDGTDREVVCSTFAIDRAGSRHTVAVLEDLTETRVAARTAVALAQTTAQLVGAATTSQILTGIARHAVEGTRALSCGITQVSPDHKLASAGAYGPDGPGYGVTNPAWMALADVPVEEAIEAMTTGTITFAEPPGKPAVVPDARLIWEENPLTKPFAANLQGVDWQGGVYVPLPWENRVIGFLAVFLPSGLTGPSETELAFYTALADQAAVAVTNARFTAGAKQAAALLERTRLARELHDSVSQTLFSMTMHARAAQLSSAKARFDDHGPLGRSILLLGELTRAAMAEMRALIFELRPGALAEEGLVDALRKQSAALTAHEQVTITVEGPEQRLELSAGVEEHLYRIASEALHNVVKHAGANRATVRVAIEGGTLEVVISDDGAGFDPETEHPGHLGLSTMTERAGVIGADLAIISAPTAGTTVAVTLPYGRDDQEGVVKDAR